MIYVSNDISAVECLNRNMGQSHQSQISIVHSDISVPQTNENGTKDTILLVDDEFSVLISLKRQLRNDFNIATAGSGPAALEQIGNGGEFGVVVSDLAMPGMNGIQFLTKVRTLLPNAALILLTGIEDHASAVAAVNTFNVFRYLLKPCPADILKGALTDALAANEEKARLKDLDSHFLNLKQEKSHFLSTISHELRTPMHQILGLSEMILTDSSGGVEGTHLIEHIHSSARALNSMLNDLILLADLRYGQTIDVERCNAGHIFANCLEYVRELASERNIGVHATQDIVSQAIYVHQGAFEHALRCLLGNAVKFNRDGGELHFVIRIENQKVIFEISDTGIGMAIEKIDIAYTPFSQLDSGYSRHYNGLGIGLSLAKELIEQQGGDLLLYTNEWGGVTASVSLQIVPEWLD